LSFIIGILFLAPISLNRSSGWFKGAPVLFGTYPRAQAQADECQVNADCPPGKQCGQLNGVGTKYCIQSCQSTSECGAGQQCTNSGTDVEGNPISVCFTTCESSVAACGNITFFDFIAKQSVPTCCSNFFIDFGTSTVNVCAPNNPDSGLALPCLCGNGT